MPRNDAIIRSGTRLLTCVETIVNRMGEGIEQKLVDAKLSLYKGLMTNIGIGELV